MEPWLYKCILHTTLCWCSLRLLMWAVRSYRAADEERKMIVQAFRPVSDSTSLEKSCIDGISTAWDRSESTRSELHDVVCLHEIGIVNSKNNPRGNFMGSSNNCVTPRNNYYCIIPREWAHSHLSTLYLTASHSTSCPHCILLTLDPASLTLQVASQLRWWLPIWLINYSQNINNRYGKAKRTRAS